MLNRRRAYDGEPGEEYTVKDVIQSHGGTNIDGPHDCTKNGSPRSNGYAYDGNTAFSGDRRFTNSTDTLDYMVHQEYIDHMNASKQETYIQELLQQHPEGICVRSKNHWIVITDYEIVDGKVQYYAIDPVSPPSTSGRDKLETTWEYADSSKLNKGNIFGQIEQIMYVKN